MPTTYDVHVPTTDREEKADIDLTSTADMRAAANRALEWRREYGRGGTPVGMARARDIAGGKQLSRETVTRMVSFFARHGNNRAKHYELRDGKPTTWRIAWDLWGGDPGRSWANRKWKELQSVDVEKANHSKSRCMKCDAPPAVDVLWNGGKSRAWFCDKCFPQWSVDKGTSVVSVNRVDGIVPGRYKVNNSPNEKRSRPGRAIMKNDAILKVNGDLVTLADLGRAWLSKAERFTSAPWNNPESDLSAEDLARVALIDLNPPGEKKIKANIKLPVKSTPDGPVNLNALRAAASYLPQTDAPPEVLREAARKLVRLMRAGGIEPGEATLRNAGMADTEKAWEVEIISKTDEKRICYGIALRPDVPDLQNDIYTSEEVEKAAHRFMIHSRKADWMHEKTLPQSDAIPVESYIAPADFEVNGYQIKKGDWVVGMHVPNPDYWEKIKKGEARAFSIRGFGKRTPVG